MFEFKNSEIHLNRNKEVFLKKLANINQNPKNYSLGSRLRTAVSTKTKSKLKTKQIKTLHQTYIDQAESVLVQEEIETMLR